MKQLATLFILAALISSCSSKAKQRIGLTNSGPNEYSVTKNKPLEMPPHIEPKEVKGK